MTEEEKKAIELLEEFKKTGYHTLSVKYGEDRIHTNKLIERSLETLLNLIQKQDTEINKLNNKIKELEKERDYYKKMYAEFNNAFIKGGNTEE